VKIQQAAFRDNVLEGAAYLGVTVLLCTIIYTDLGVELFHVVDESSCGEGC
jgi:hypothetical protein